MIIFAVTCQLLMVNLFIAMLSETFENTSDCEKEWLRQWALQILCIEFTMTMSERKKMLEKYTNFVDGKRVITNVWKQSVRFIFLMLIYFYLLKLIFKNIYFM